jgi:NAD(P)-dependent dehydrogenase (short-subunit alcohol dehydrogenase family)
LATNLKGLTAVVTGGGSGIGRAMCLNWADAGMNVAVVDLLADRAEVVAEEVRAKGVNAVPIACDVGDAAAVASLADRAYEAFGSVNVICNNAGVVQFGPVALAPQDDWDWLFRVNLWGVVNVMRTFVPRLRAQGEGLRHIVNTASLSGIFAVPGLGVYTASKYAVVGISETLRDEVARDGIGVSVLCPGPTPSRIGETARTTTEPGRGAFEDAGQFNFLESRTAEQVAACVRDGVLANRLYIFSHKNGLRAADRRFKEVVGDFGVAP